MKKKTPLQKTSRMMSLILLLAALPFALMTLEKKLSPLRKVASDGSSNSSEMTVEHDLSEASPEEFKKAFKYQVLKDAHPIETSEGPGVVLGSFLLKNADGAKVFVCEEYPTVDLIFAAEGVAFSGEIPQMVVRTPCLISEDQHHLEAAAIPFATILKSPLQQFEFTASVPGSREQGKVFFRNVVEFWPTEWTWIGVKFYGKNPENTLSINGYEVISVLGQPLILKASE
ncbi:hypothetical protein QJS83_16655 [Bdellovibrio sp. 22V]|uniref:hypothetical protein n=1 Tax=Bdellovibrio TaxID=958 RepID=UPI002542B770|nr:hypothetical protein [Bdellovibrio sp. 22V]WII72094.1 hypothetical protein QJS83_16655 [Bdellovibrio sp. 22V]